MLFADECRFLHQHWPDHFHPVQNQTNLREQQTTKLKYRKLAKATLVLLAVFGIHFFLLIIVERLVTTWGDGKLEIAWLAFDLFIVSFQVSCKNTIFAEINAPDA